MRRAQCGCASSADAKSGHGHLTDKVKEGRRVWLGELVEHEMAYLSFHGENAGRKTERTVQPRLLTSHVTSRK
ncbi:MAG TPA: hypothetical protein VFG14_01325 [Chthoniobacteraceae bacterium]|nr:hypothetical protein [Chthoniobacteraceae bacterium]